MWARSWLLLPLILCVVKSSKLNVSRDLLPYSNTPPSFPLICESGCYTWSSTRPEVVHQVKPDNVGYSSSAIIQAKATENLRCMTWKDSPYNTEHILEKLESQGSQ